jgi:hypothetical protein
MRRTGLASSLGVFGLVVACGGGGGSGSGGGGSQAEITPANAESIASDVLGALSLSAEYSLLGESFGGILPADANAENDGGSLRGLAEAVRIALAADPGDGLPSLPGGGISPTGGSFGPATEACDGGGTVTFSGSNSGSPDLGPGDRISARFEDCFPDEKSDRIDGTLSLRIVALTGDLDTAYAIVLDIGVEELAFGTGIDSLAMDGGATTEFDNTTPPLLESSAEGERLRFQTGSGNDITLRGFEVVLERDTNDDEFDVVGDGRLTSDDWSGEVVYEVTQNLIGDIEVDMPDDGAVLVTGDGTAMRILVLDAVDVRLEVDTDGDDIFETVIMTTWSTLGF